MSLMTFIEREVGEFYFLKMHTLASIVASGTCSPLCRATLADATTVLCQMCCQLARQRQTREGKQCTRAAERRCHKGAETRESSLKCNSSSDNQVGGSLPDLSGSRWEPRRWPGRSGWAAGRWSTAGREKRRVSQQRKITVTQANCGLTYMADILKARTFKRLNTKESERD